jgi:hypothetical protein
MQSRYAKSQKSYLSLLVVSHFGLRNWCVVALVCLSSLKGTLQGCQESDHALLSPHAELQAYLESPLELTDDVVGWWGVCVSFLIQFDLLINEMYRNIKFSI